VKVEKAIFPATTILILMFPLLALGQVYRWTDEKGRTHYGDKPPAERAATEVQNRISSYAGPAKVSSAPAPAAKAPSGDGTARVTLYSAVWCKYCKQAKAFFAKRGVRYAERDVDTADARSEYERLGARGVPVILVGRQRMDGFDQRRMESMLRSEGL
jgi:glutaredoxin